MSNNQISVQKTESQWPIGCELQAKKIHSSMWSTTQWQLIAFNLHPENPQESVSFLHLYRDERTEYRFNLSSSTPKLFAVLDPLNGDCEPKLLLLTAAQSVAANYMEGEHLVFSLEMPLPVQAWIEAFIGRHGELLDFGRKKRKNKRLDDK